jgi:branched-chain amino acid transport system substrate-binding protein
MVAEVASQQKWAGPGNTIEVVGFDGKGSPQDSKPPGKNSTRITG